MRQTVAKRLRQAALQEMIGDGVPKRDLVWGRNSVVNSPQSVRAMYLRLKSAWNADTGQTPALVTPRQRTPSGWHVPVDLKRSVAWIASPLKQLRKLYPGTTRPDGTFEVSPNIGFATELAAQGYGGNLQRMARAYL